MKRGPIAIVLCAMLFAVGCGGDDSSGESTEASEATTAEAPAQSEPGANKTKPKITATNGAPPQELEVEDLEEGSGAEANSGNEVTVQYVGANYKSGKEFDASWGREPFSFALGAGQVIPGWDQGIVGMKVGGRRKLTIPPELAYGEAGSPPAIPPNETLVFVVDLLAVE